MHEFKWFGAPKKENPYSKEVTDVIKELRGKDFLDVTYRHAEAFAKRYAFANLEDPEAIISKTDFVASIIATYESRGLYRQADHTWLMQHPEEHRDVAAWLVIFGKITLPEHVNANTFMGLDMVMDVIDPALQKIPPWAR